MTKLNSNYKNKLFSSLFVLNLMSSSLYADAVMDKSRLVDRLSLILTGQLATAEVRQDFVSGEKDLAEIAASYKQTAAFKQQISRYWMEVLGIKVPVHFETTSIPGGRNMINEIVRGLNQIDDNNKTIVLSSGAYQNKCFPILGRVFTAAEEISWEAHCCKQGRPAGILAANFNPGTPVNVNPWWDPNQTVQACPGLVEETSCGANLSKCFPIDGTLDNANLTGIARDENNRYVRDLFDGFSHEPGRIVARVISQDLPWDEVIVGHKSEATGVMQHFLKNTTWGQVLVAAAPSGSWQDLNGVVNLAQAANPTNVQWYPIEHANLGRHAGVLTTVGFQKITNGHYAKANLAMEAFLCKSFQAPEGALAIPQSSETEPSQKPFCKSCHSVLDPMAQFMSRWPKIGSTNYFYDTTAGLSATGEFANKQGADTLGLAKIFAGMEEFKTCAIKHSFKFLVGRDMSESERTNLIPRLLDVYNDNNKKIWPVMEEIINSTAFKGGE